MTPSTPHYLDRPFNNYKNDAVAWSKAWIKAKMIPMIEKGMSYDEIKTEFQYDKRNNNRKKRFDEIYATLYNYKNQIAEGDNLNKWLIYGGIGIVVLFVVFILLRLRK